MIPRCLVTVIFEEDQTNKWSLTPLNNVQKVEMTNTFGILYGIVINQVISVSHVCPHAIPFCIQIKK